jgi:TPR repeat protein
MNRHCKIVMGQVILGVLLTAFLAVVGHTSEPPKIDASMSLDQLKSMAEKGNTDAMLEFGERLIQGQGTEVNIDEGLQWLQKAADAGNHQAWYDLGFVYSNGLKDSVDIGEAMKYFRKGADLGNADCQTSMGLIYQAGERIPGGLKAADPVEAAKWYGMAAEQGHTEAIQHLAMMNAVGMGIKQDDLEAVRWFRKGAELGNADCIWGLGQCYLDGKGVQQDSVMAYSLYFASLDGVENPEQKKAMTERCDLLGKALTAEQLKKAEPLIQEWKAKEKK